MLDCLTFGGDSFQDIALEWRWNFAVKAVAMAVVQSLVCENEPRRSGTMVIHAWFVGLSLSSNDGKCVKCIATKKGWTQCSAFLLNR